MCVWSGVSFQQIIMLVQLGIHLVGEEKVNLHPYLIPHAKISLRWVTDSNIKASIVKLLGEIIWEQLHKFEVEKVIKEHTKIISH